VETFLAEEIVLQNSKIEQLSSIAYYILHQQITAMQPKVITHFFCVQPVYSPAEPGQVTGVEHYSDLEFMEKVGGGGYGTVSKGRWISRNKIVAIKTLIVFDQREVNTELCSCIARNTLTL